MLQVSTTKRFEKDLARVKKRGKDIAKLEDIVDRLSCNMSISAKHRPHKLTGNWEGYSELHVEPDWLLIYEITESVLYLARTGTHSDLF